VGRLIPLSLPATSLGVNRLRSHYSFTCTLFSVRVMPETAE
jgi:hypothetical protein